jgi:hypothetical protein
MAAPVWLIVGLQVATYTLRLSFWGALAGTDPLRKNRIDDF